jgi:hypothetical protein
VVSSFTRISYGAQELAVFLLVKFTFLFYRNSIKGRKKNSFPKINGRRTKGGELSMSIFDDAEVIATYPLKQAIKDGRLVEIFKNRWDELSGGKPIVATSYLFNEISLAGLREIWNEYVKWQKEVRPTLPQKQHLFVTTMNSKTVWVIEDEAAYTLMYPEDY